MERWTGMGLQWISAESRHRHMSHKSAVFLPQWSAALLSVRWALGEKQVAFTRYCQKASSRYRQISGKR